MIRNKAEDIETQSPIQPLQSLAAAVLDRAIRDLNNLRRAQKKPERMDLNVHERRHFELWIKAENDHTPGSLNFWLSIINITRNDFISKNKKLFSVFD